MSKYFDGEKLNGFDESPETTIFGEKHFIDKLMISIIEERGKAIDNFVYDEIEGIAKYEFPMPKIIINKEKVKKWLIMCSKLENIEHSELVDMAVKKKISDLEAKLAESEENLKLEKQNSKMWFCWKEIYFKELQQAKQQLAEKEKEIEELKKITSNVIVPRRLTKIEMNKLINKQTLTAIIELEKVKEFCEKWKHYTENINYVIVEEKNGIRCNPTLYEEIDNQIKQLKEAK